MNTNYDGAFDALYRRIHSEMIDSLDEELELEIDDAGLDASLEGMDGLAEQDTPTVLNLGGTLDDFIQNTLNYPTLAEAYKIAAQNAFNRMPALAPARASAVPPPSPASA